MPHAKMCCAFSTWATIKKPEEPYIDRIMEQGDPVGLMFSAKNPFSSRSGSPWIYPKNAGGKILFAAGLPDYSKAACIVLRTQIHSDLLALEISKQLGELLEIKDVYAPNAYLYDEQEHRFYSVGLDGIPKSKDDVFL